MQVEVGSFPMRDVFLSQKAFTLQRKSLLDLGKAFQPARLILSADVFSPKSQPWGNFSEYANTKGLHACGATNELVQYDGTIVYHWLRASSTDQIQ